MARERQNYTNETFVQRLGIIGGDSPLAPHGDGVRAQDSPLSSSRLGAAVTTLHMAMNTALPMSTVAATIRQTWRYRELIYFFAWRDVKVRYKQAALGAAWAVLQPLATMVIFSLLFGRLAKIPSDDVPYPLFAYVGLIMWTYFSGVAAHSVQSLIANSNLVSKVYFPRVALPASAALSGLLDLAISSCFVVVLMVYYGVFPGWPVVLAPLYLVALVLITVGFSLVLAALAVSYRDVKYTVPLLLQLGLFVTPVIYPASFVPHKLQFLLLLNPLARIVEGLRGCLLKPEWPAPGTTVLSLLVAVLVFAGGWFYFGRAERSFADII